MKGRFKEKHGYIMVGQLEHPFVNRRGYVREHRLIWEEYHKAMVLPYAVVHHINGIKDDNRIENLEIMSKSEHMKLHSMGNTRGQRNMTDRICFLCNSNGTSLQKTKNMGLRPIWRTGPLTGKLVCHKCYEYERRWERKNVC